MRGSLRPLGLAALAVCLLRPVPLKAGVYNPAEPMPGPSPTFGQYHRELTGLRSIAFKQDRPEKDSPQRRHYLARVSELEPRARAGDLGVEGRVSLSAYYLYLMDFEKAVEVLRQAEAREPQNFMVLANLATAHQLADRPERAISYLELALKHWPRVWAGWTARQLDWTRRGETAHLQLLRLRRQEALRQPGGPARSPERVDALFPVQFGGADGTYEPGTLAWEQRSKLPPDAVAVVEQLLLWLPHDTRLYWLLGELLNADGQVVAAATVLDEVVNRGYSARELRQHRVVLLEAKRLVNHLEPWMQEGQLLWWLAPRGAAAAPGEALLSEGCWVGTLAELRRGDAAPVAAAAGRAPEAKAAPAADSWLPDPRQLVVVGSVTGLVVAALAYLQLREIRRRRQSGAPAPKG
jgi:tetratricopeptide (TPR) repeat protein